VYALRSGEGEGERRGEERRRKRRRRRRRRKRSISSPCIVFIQVRRFVLELVLTFCTDGEKEKTTIGGGSGRAGLV
jgi:hypothetical protein